MVLALDPAAAVAGVLVEFQRLLVPPQLVQRAGQVACGRQGLGVVLALDPAAAVVGVLVEFQRLLASP